MVGATSDERLSFRLPQLGAGGKQAQDDLSAIRANRSELIPLVAFQSNWPPTATTFSLA